MKPILSLAMQQLFLRQAADGEKFCTLCAHSDEIPGGHLICNYQSPGYPTGINVKEVRKREGLCGWRDPRYFVLDERLRAEASAPNAGAQAPSEAR
jgi:hypothetical protein